MTATERTILATSAVVCVLVAAAAIHSSRDLGDHGRQAG